MKRKFCFLDLFQRIKTSKNRSYILFMIWVLICALRLMYLFKEKQKGPFPTNTTNDIK